MGTVVTTCVLADGDGGPESKQRGNIKQRQGRRRHVYIQRPTALAGDQNAYRSVSSDDAVLSANACMAKGR